MKKTILILIVSLTAVSSWWALSMRMVKTVPSLTQAQVKIQTKSPTNAPANAPIAGILAKPAVKISSSIQTQTAMQALVESQVRQMAATDLNTSYVQSDLQRQADSFSNKDLQSLENILLSSQATQDERSVSLYLLSLSGAKALPALTHFSVTALPEFSHLQDPHSAGSLNKSFEMSLRIATLEAIDHLSEAKNTTSQVQTSLQQILKTQNDPTLKMLAEVSLAGIQSGKPQKLSRLIQAMVNE